MSTKFSLAHMSTRGRLAFIAKSEGVIHTDEISFISGSCHQMCNV